MIRALLACILGVGVASGAQWPKTFPVSSPVQLRLQASRGSISVTGWDRPEIAVTISPGKIPIHDVLTGNRLDLRVDAPDAPARIVIQAPRQIDCEIRSQSGSISIAGINGSLSIAGGGHIRVGGRFDLLIIENGFGNVELEVAPGSRVTPRWRIATDVGDIRVRTAPDLRTGLETALHTGAGRVRVLALKSK